MADTNSKLRAKRDITFDQIIFEVDLNDCSPEHSPKQSADNQQKSGERSFSYDSGIFSQEGNLSTIVSHSEEDESEDAELKKASQAFDEVDCTVIEKDVNCTIEQCKDGKERLCAKEIPKETKDCKEDVIEEHIRKGDVEKQAFIGCDGAEGEIVKDFPQNLTGCETIIIDDDSESHKQVQANENDDSIDTEGLMAETKSKTCETIVIDDSQNKIQEVDIETDMVDSKASAINKDDSIQSIINISFKDADIAKQYKPYFLELISSFLELNVKDADENSLTLEVTRDSNLPSTERVIVDQASPSSPKSERGKSRKRKRSERKKEKDLFTLDTNPTLSTKEVPLRYLRKFSVVENGEQKEGSAKVYVQTCFNCEGNHPLRECPLPKNYAKINAAKANLKNNQMKSGRYHLEGEQKYGNFAPGKISDGLRKALGLYKHELPPYIYKMRVFGYPPGWIKEAETEPASDLSLFDIDGKSVSNHKRKKCGIDPEKIIDYPGFNTPMEKGVPDVPPFSQIYNKQIMIDVLNKRRAKEEDDLEICDMDVDTVVEESVTEVSENDVSQDSQDEMQMSCRASPTLNDLEARKQQLLAELDTNTNSNNSKCNDTLKKSESDSESSAIVKMSSFGTPILKSASPYSKLPKPDNFSQNISPVLNFENLPNATGKYEQMTGVLQKVRSALKKVQNEKNT